jgi:hypothetical protein
MERWRDTDESPFECDVLMSFYSLSRDRALRQSRRSTSAGKVLPLSDTDASKIAEKCHQFFDHSLLLCLMKPSQLADEILMRGTHRMLEFLSPNLLKEICDELHIKGSSSPATMVCARKHMSTQAIKEGEGESDRKREKERERVPIAL